MAKAWWFRLCSLFVPLVILFALPRPIHTAEAEAIWEVRAVDTMKVSRDTAREPIDEAEIRAEIEAVKSVGANYVGIATPYDEEFYPVLRAWVDIAREYDLKVWFRGNFSGWEGWFDYPKTLTRTEHLDKTRNFILSHPNLFEDGDSFSPCPECENGGDGDPRFTGDKAGFNQFLLDQHQVASKAFSQIDKQVTTNWFSMNGDIAREILTPETVAATGGVVTIDHYVNSFERMERDLLALHQQHNAQILLGEFGAPIPDLQGELTPRQQAEYIDGLFQIFYRHQDIILGMNYWTGRFASTSIFDPDLTPRPAADVVANYYQPGIISGQITDELNEPIAGVSLISDDGLISTTTNTTGHYSIHIPRAREIIHLKAAGYHEETFGVVSKPGETQIQDFELTPLQPSWLYRVRLLIKRFIN